MPQQRCCTYSLHSYTAPYILHNELIYPVRFGMTNIIMTYVMQENPKMLNNEGMLLGGDVLGVGGGGGGALWGGHYYIQGGFATFFSNVLTTEQRFREIVTFISNVDVWKIFWKQKATFKRKSLLQCSQHCSHLCSNTKLLSHNLCQGRGG
jgi:hypothetical protein